MQLADAHLPIFIRLSVCEQIEANYYQSTMKRKIIFNASNGRYRLTCVFLGIRPAAIARLSKVHTEYFAQSTKEFYIVTKNSIVNKIRRPRYLSASCKICWDINGFFFIPRGTMDFLPPTHNSPS